MNNSMKAAAKKMAAMIAAGAMTVAPVAATINLTSVNAFAAMAGTQPSATDTGTVTISGVEPGATVKLYKIVEANIDSTGYHGWQATASAGSANVTEQTDATTKTKSWKANVSTLMTLINTGKGADGKDWAPAYSTAATPKTVTEGTTAATDKTVSYTADVAPGEYLVVVEPSGNFETSYIYSPMLVSLFYKENNNGFELSSGVESTVGADGSMTEAAGSAVYAKRSPVTLTKKITNPDGDAQGVASGDTKNSSVTGDDLQVGDTQTFTITTAIPDYRGYTNLDENKLTFKLEDNQDAGFNKPTSDPVVTVITGSGETAKSTVLTKDTDYTLVYGKFANDPDNTAGYGDWTADAEPKNDFVITFKKTALLANPGATVTVVYSSVLNSNATQKSSANDNDVTLTYTNSNKTENNTGELTDHTYDYTFPIDVVKVDANDQETKLANAEFTIKRVSKAATATDGSVFTAYTDANGVHAGTASTGTKSDTDGNGVVVTAETTGLATFKDLDEGYYEIWESKAPSGYAQNTEHFYIGITPSYGNDGKLTAYTVTQYKADGSVVGSKVKDADGKETDETVSSSASLTLHTTIADDTHDTLTVTDTKMSSLPSTGARSALILTIVGIAVMVTVMAASRKKKIAD